MAGNRLSRYQANDEWLFGHIPVQSGAMFFAELLLIFDFTLSGQYVGSILCPARPRLYVGSFILTSGQCRIDRCGRFFTCWGTETGGLFCACCPGVETDWLTAVYEFCIGSLMLE